MDDYNNLIVSGQHYLSGHYLESESRSRKGGKTYYVYLNKTVLFQGVDSVPICTVRRKSQR